MATAKRPRTLDSFFKPPPTKKSRPTTDVELQQGYANTGEEPEPAKCSSHPAYPFAIADLLPEVSEALNFTPASEGQTINDRPDLDLVYFQPYIPSPTSRHLFDYLRRELFYYRVKYTIKRGPVETQVNTPRFTTVFGVDATARFLPDGSIADAATGRPVSRDAYKCRPRPMPAALAALRALTERATGCGDGDGGRDGGFNFALVNYYAGGDDSISYHSDDERFLGPEPAIASFSLGARRDFLLKHKPTPPTDGTAEAKQQAPLKLALGTGDMVLMRGRTQANWLHSIPKRKGAGAGGGRINVTFRRAMVKGGTENYYRYNVGDGEVYRWDEGMREMVQWKSLALRDEGMRGSNLDLPPHDLSKVGDDLSKAGEHVTTPENRQK